MKDTRAITNPAVNGTGALQRVLRITGVAANAVGLNVTATGQPLTAYQIRKITVDNGNPGTAAQISSSITADFTTTNAHVVGTDGADPTLLASGGTANHTISTQYVAVLEVWATQAAGGSLIIVHQVVS